MYKAIIVDDEEINLEFTKNLLRKFEVFESIRVFTNPLKAFEAFKENKPDIIFTDIEMPYMSGLEFAERILELDPSIKIVFITAFDCYAIKAFELNALDYVLKPIHADRLYKTLNRLIENHKDKSNYESCERLFVNTFGNLEVFRGNRHIRWKGAKTAELFAFLLENHNKGIHKDIIVETMWPEYEYKIALRNMQTAMCRLRQSLGELGSQIRIEYSCNHYKIELKNVFCDLIEFEQKTRNIIHISPDTVSNVMEALELYTGHYLEKDDYLWAIAKQSSVKNRFYDLLMKTIKYYLKNSKIEEGKYLLERIIERNPEDITVKLLSRKFKEHIEAVKTKSYALAK